MISIFISYSRRDSGFANQIVDRLRGLSNNHRLDLWWDQKLVGGEEWWNEILNNIVGRSHFVALLSGNYLDSVACVQELNWARETHRYIIPVNIEIGLANNDTRISEILEGTHIIPSNPARDNDSLLTAIIAGIKDTLNKHPNNPDLPERLPTPPKLPLHPLEVIARRLRRKDDINISDISSHIDTLREFVIGDNEYREKALSLLSQLRDQTHLPLNKYYINYINDILNLYGNRTIQQKSRTPLKKLRVSSTSPKAHSSAYRVSSRVPKYTKTIILTDNDKARVSKIVKGIQSPEAYIEFGFQLETCLSALQYDKLMELRDRLGIKRNLNTFAIASELARDSQLLIQAIEDLGSLSGYLSQCLYETCINFAIDSLSETNASEVS